MYVSLTDNHPIYLYLHIYINNLNKLLSLPQHTASRYTTLLPLVAGRSLVVLTSSGCLERSRPVFIPYTL